MKRMIMISLLCLACFPALAGERWRMISYECSRIDADKAGFTCKLTGKQFPILVLTYSDFTLQASSADARYLRRWFIYRWIDNGGVHFQEVVPGQNRWRRCFKPSRSIEYSCNDWFPIEAADK